VARPAVVWFGEMLADADLRAAVQATVCDVFLTVGTSSLVYPAAGLLHLARRGGAFAAEVNPGATGASGDVDLAIAAPAEDALPMLDVRIRMG
jgi:NAD-dependent deacetylase